MDDLKTTIFGEESFFDKYMVKIYEATNKYVYDKFSSAVKVAMPLVEIDEERLKKWINLCLKLENIEQSELIDMATKKKFLDLQSKLESKERQVSVYAKEIGFLDARIAELKEIIQKKEPDMFIMASRQNGKIIATKIKLKELQNETAIKELKKARNKIKSIPYKDFGIIYKSDVISVLDKQLEKLSN